MDGLVLQDQNTDRDNDTGSLGKANSGLDRRLYAQQDANWNTTSVVSATNSQVVERYEYDPYGKASYLNANWTGRTGSAYGWEVLHQGGTLDAETGLYLFRHRFYSPTLGRWMQQDPMGTSMGRMPISTCSLPRYIAYAPRRPSTDRWKVKGSHDSTNYVNQYPNRK